MVRDWRLRQEARERQQKRELIRTKMRGPTPAPPPPTPPPPPPPTIQPSTLSLQQASAAPPLLAIPAPQPVPTVNSVGVPPPTTTVATLPVSSAPAVAVQNAGGQPVIQPPPSGASSSPMEDVELTGLGPMTGPPFALVPPNPQTPVDVFDMSALLAALPVYLPVSMDIDVADEEAGVDNDELMEDAPAVVVEQQLGSRPHQQAAQTVAQLAAQPLVPQLLPVTQAQASQCQPTILLVAQQPHGPHPLGGGPSGVAPALPAPVFQGLVAPQPASLHFVESVSTAPRGVKRRSTGEAGREVTRAAGPVIRGASKKQRNAADSAPGGSVGGGDTARSENPGLQEPSQTGSSTPAVKDSGAGNPNAKSDGKPPRGASRPVKIPVAPKAPKKDRGTGSKEVVPSGSPSPPQVLAPSTVPQEERGTGRKEVDPSGSSSSPQVPPPATGGKACWQAKGKWKEGSVPSGPSRQPALTTAANPVLFNERYTDRSQVGAPKQRAPATSVGSSRARSTPAQPKQQPTQPSSVFDLIKGLQNKKL
jgi:hypothetical protein